MKVIEYKTVVENYLEILNTTVNNYMKVGWQPLGSMSIHETRHYQTLVKYERYNRKTGPN